MPNELLSRYFDELAIALAVPWEKLKPTEMQPVQRPLYWVFGLVRDGFVLAVSIWENTVYQVRYRLLH